jgi:hypothetical protein
MKHHDLRIEAEYAMQKALGNKPFEVRYNDRDFKAGDTITYFSAEHPAHEYSGTYTITYVTDYKQKPGFVVFGDRLATNT